MKATIVESEYMKRGRKDKDAWKNKKLREDKEKVNVG